MANYGNMNPVIIYGSSGKEYAKKIHNYIQGDPKNGYRPINKNFVLGEMNLKTFPNGEPDPQIGTNVRRRDVYVVQSFYPKDTIPSIPEKVKKMIIKGMCEKYDNVPDDTINDIIENVFGILGDQLLDSKYRRVYDTMELLAINDAARRASAGRIINIVTSYPYGRGDRKARGRQPIPAKMFARLLETTGIDGISAMDLHSDQIQGFFEVPCDNLKAGYYFLHDIKKKYGGFENLVFIGADAGAVKSMKTVLEDSHIEELEDTNVGWIDKKRRSEKDVTIHGLKGSVDIGGKRLISMDDIIDTAGTLEGLTECAMGKRKAPESITFYATEGIFSDPATERIDRLYEKYEVDVVVTDALNHPQSYVDERGWLRLIHAYPSFAHVIDRTDAAESVSDMLFTDFKTFENNMFKLYPFE
jgi:ribose-phosphate pyrophosphokinase